MRIAGSVSGGAFAAAMFIACGNVSYLGTPLEGVLDGGIVSTTLTAADDAACVPAPSPPSGVLDAGALPSCCTAGAARCVPLDYLSDAEVSALAACTGGACVPESLIALHGAKPASCLSLGDAGGVCLSVCVPQVAEFATILPRATCAADERCAPCVSPLSNAPTGACDIGCSSP